MGLSFQPPGQPVNVPYMDLGGGLNLRLDPHALARNELAVSQNLWSSYDFAVAKRPGTVPWITPGGVVNNDGGNLAGVCKSLLAVRFGDGNTWLVYVAGNGSAFIARSNPVGIGHTWRTIGNFAASAAFVTCAQMYSSGKQSQAAFFCDGVNTPQVLYDPSTGSLQDVSTGVGKCPTKYNQGPNGTPITPQFVSTVSNNALLVYSGEPSNKSAVYISNPLYPEDFTTPGMQITNDPVGAYLPAIIGNNDGVEGGPITGLATMGSAIIVFKDAAIYSMVQTTLLGEIVAWQVTQISVSTGCIAPQSIVNFDTFVVFVGICGVYQTDGQMLQLMSNDVAPIFDSTLNGFPAIMTNPAVAIAVRHGQRYELFYATGKVGYPNQGIWFDFSKQTRFGNPIAGLIVGMTPGGMAELRGPNDDGNVAWGDSQQNRVGCFGVGYSDFGSPISAIFAGKADLFDDIFGPEAAISDKQIQDAYALIEVPNAGTTGDVQLDFYGQVAVDIGTTLGRVIAQPIESELTAGEWGLGDWGDMLWGSTAQGFFVVMKIPLQNAARGHMLQVAIKETSIYPWIMIGYVAYVNFQKVGY
jgi:hypothetical protein